jgi:transposase-like protein
MDDFEPIAGYINKRTMLEALYEEEGLSVKSISHRLGISTAAIIRWMRELGIDRRSRGGANSPAHLGWKLHRIDPRVVFRLSIRDVSRLVQVSESYTFKFRKGWQVIWTFVSLVQQVDSNDTQR